MINVAGAERVHMTKRKILIVDDHAMMRQGIRALLDGTEDVQTVGEASDGKEAVERALELGPDLTIMDISMPGIDGVEATQRIMQANTASKILVLSQHESSGYILSAIKAGAVGYVPKKAAGPELLSAIAVVSRGESFLHPSAAAVLVDAYRQDKNPDRLARDMSELDRKILELISLSFTSRQIGQQLGMTEKAVTRRRVMMMHKLDDKSVSGLIRFALQFETGSRQS